MVDTVLKLVLAETKDKDDKGVKDANSNHQDLCKHYLEMKDLIKPNVLHTLKVWDN